jgi:GNAT superfamily N-acetyltransferase
MSSERDHRPDGETPPENDRAAERRNLRGLEEHARFENQLKESGGPRETPEDRVSLRRVSPEVLDHEGGDFHIQRGSRDIGTMSLEYDHERRVATLVDFKIGDPADRGRGIGTESLRQAEAHAREQGMGEMRGELSRVDTDFSGEDPVRGRERLANFYRKNGYDVQLNDNERQPIFGSLRKRL